jgi:hypothetical protein
LFCQLQTSADTVRKSELGEIKKEREIEREDSQKVGERKSGEREKEM